MRRQGEGERGIRRVIHRAAVLGSPVAHSLSPALHRAGFAAAGLAEWAYDRIECDGQRLPGLVRRSGSEWAGYSVTMPGKAAAAEVADARSGRVELLGVANTLWRGPQGWHAENTDVDGVLGALRAAGIVPGRVLVLGGGGTALSVVAALAELGSVSLTMAGRRPDSTADCVELSRQLGIDVAVTDLTLENIASVVEGIDLVLSTLPAGAPDHLAATLAGVPALFDAVYHPWPTPLAAASTPGRVTITGLDMLLHQAFRQFELFTGHDAPRAAMRQGLIAASGTDLALPVE
jgi:shikimate dehydrogenase